MTLRDWLLDLLYESHKCLAWICLPRPGEAALAFPDNLILHWYEKRAVDEKDESKGFEVYGLIEHTGLDKVESVDLIPTVRLEWMPFPNQTPKVAVWVKVR